MTDLHVLHPQRLVFRRPEPYSRPWLQKKCLLRVNVHVTVWATSCHTQDLDILKDDGGAAAWWAWSRLALQQSNQVVGAGRVWIFQAFGFFQRHIPSVTMKCCPSICSWVKQYFSIYQQEKELGINNSVSTKMLLVKIVFRYFWDVYCANPDQCTAALCPCIQSDIPTWCQWPHALISDELTCSPTHQD